MHPADDHGSASGGRASASVGAEARFLERLLDAAPAVVFLLADDLSVRWLNRSAADLFGYEPDEVVGRSVLDFIDAEWDLEALESIGTAMGAQGLRQPMLFRTLRADGTRVIVEVTANVQFDDPVLGGMVVYARRWDERYLFDQVLEAMAASAPFADTLRLLVAIAEAETLEALATVLYDRHDDRFLGSVASSGLAAELREPEPAADRDLVAAWGPLLAEAGQGRVWAVDELPPAIAGPARQAGLRTCWTWPAETGDAVVVAWRREDHTDIDQTRRRTMARLARLAGLVLDRARSQDRLAHAAAHDALTGLANRAAFYEALDAALAAPEPAPERAAATPVPPAPAGPVGVLVVDLDGFKPINDQHGHGAGDRLLAEIGRRMAAGVPAAALAARVGGDEFAVVWPSCGGIDELAALGDRLVASIRRPLTVRGGRTVSVGASVGVAVADPGAIDADHLVEAADAALYEAKGSGGGVRRAPVDAAGATGTAAS